MKLVVKENLKTYLYLYLMTAPFTYLVTKVGKIYGRNDEGAFLFLNIFVALSFWVYIKKIQPLLSAENKNNKTNILLFLLIATVTLLSIKSVSLSSEIKFDVSSIESDVSSIKDKISSIESDMSSMESDLSMLQLEVSSLVDR